MPLNLCSLGHKRNKLCLHPHLYRKYSRTHRYVPVLVYYRSVTCHKCISRYIYQGNVLLYVSRLMFFYMEFLSRFLVYGPSYS